MPSINPLYFGAPKSERTVACDKPLRVIVWRDERYCEMRKRKEQKQKENRSNELNELKK
jgi:uncharacterized protein (DUF302 family)